MDMLRRINKRDMMFRVTTALCLSSVTEGTAKVSLSLGLSVTLTVITTGIVILTASMFSAGGTPKACGAVTATCVGISLASSAVAFLGLDSLTAGILVAATVIASLIISGYSGREYSIIESILGSVIFTAAITSAGVIREAFGVGKLFGYELSLLENISVGVLKAPSGGMLTCAVIAAFLRYISTLKKEISDE